MATHEDLKFEEEHIKLLKLAHNPNVNVPSITTLNLSNNKYRTVPPAPTLINFVNLRVVNLSHNRIERFVPENLVLGAPLLEELDLSYNDIRILDDIVELGSLKYLNVLTFLENPICKRYLRIKLVELLLFPSRYQVHDPVKLLTASYNIGLSKERTEKWQSLTNKNLVLRPRSESLEKNESQRRVHKGISSNDMLRLTEEKCPVPRKTRFPELVTLNGEIISVSDMQSILATQDLVSILPDGEIVKKVKKPVRFEKLHEKYVHSYMKKKERMKEEINQIPSLRRIATIVGDEGDLKLICYADHMRYGKRKILKQDYEEEVWKLSLGYKGKGGDDFLIETIQSDEEDSDESKHKSKSPKGKGKEKKKKELAGGYISRKNLKKKRWNRKISEGDIEEDEKSMSMSSNSNLSERVSPMNRRKKMIFMPDEASIEDEHEERILESHVEKPNPSENSLEDSFTQRQDKGRSLSVTKFDKERMQPKKVLFDPRSTVREETVARSKEVKLFGFRRAQTSVVNPKWFGASEGQGSPGEVTPLLRNVSTGTSGQVNIEQEAQGKKYAVVRASTPNLSLARSTGKKTVVNTGIRRSSMQSDRNKPPLSGQIVDIKKQKVDIVNQEQSDSSPELSKEGNQHRRTLTTEQVSSTREESSGKHYFHKSLSSRVESHSVSKNKTHLFLQKVGDGPGFESIDEIKEIEQSGHNPISSISKASFLTPIKKFSQKTSFQQPSVNGDFSSLATFPELSPKYAEKSPSKEIVIRGPEIDSKNNNDEVVSSTITNPLRYATGETQKLQKSPIKTEKLRVSDGQSYLKLLVAKKKAEKVKEHDREAKKLAQVIFLNRAGSTSYVKKQQEKRSSSITSMLQEQYRRQSSHILIQQQQPEPMSVQQTQQKASEGLNTQHTQESQVMFQKLFEQIVTQQKSFYSKLPGQNTDRPSFYFAKTQTSYVNTSNRFVISRSQQEQSSDLRSPEKTRLRTEDDAQISTSLSMTKRPTSSLTSRQNGGQGKVKAKSTDRKEVVLSYGEVLDRGGKYGKFVKV